MFPSFTNILRKVSETVLMMIYFMVSKGFFIQNEVMFLKGLSTAYIFFGSVIPQNMNGIFKSAMAFY
jgi:hypothetical protein